MELATPLEAHPASEVVSCEHRHAPFFVRHLSPFPLDPVLWCNVLSPVVVILATLRLFYELSFALLRAEGFRVSWSVLECVIAHFAFLPVSTRVWPSSKGKPYPFSHLLRNNFAFMG